MSSNLVELVRRQRLCGGPTAWSRLKDAIADLCQITGATRRRAAELSGLPEASVGVRGSLSKAELSRLG